MKSLIDINDSALEYSLSGSPSNETIIFIHGLGANLDQFNYQHDFFSSRYQVLSVNLPGHGGSRLPEKAGLAAFADILIGLADHLQIKKFHFVGNSMGGNIGWSLMDKVEKRILSFATFGTTAELHVSSASTKILTGLYKLLGIKTIAAMASSAGQTAESKQAVKSMMSEMNKQNLLQLVPVLADFNFLDVIEKSKIPVLIMRGIKDSDINKALASTVAALEKRGNVTLTDIPEAGHFINLDCPDIFNKTLLKFIDQ